MKIGFASLAIQAEIDPNIAYPSTNGTFPISLVTVVGEWSYLVDVCSFYYLFVIDIYLFIYYYCFFFCNVE